MSLVFQHEYSPYASPLITYTQRSLISHSVNNIWIFLSHFNDLSTDANNYATFLYHGNIHIIMYVLSKLFRSAFQN
jgi:hypothetical protein